MENEILFFTHNDMDALGCMLCTKKALPNKRFKYWHTNYQNIPQQVDDIVRYQHQNRNKFIFILDISFSNNKRELLELINTNAQILFIDHHLYPENYFDDLTMPNFKYIHDKSKSATMLSYEYFIKEDKSLHEDFYKIVNLIDVYDIWQVNRSEFLAAQYFNEYFWKNASEMSTENLMYKIINDGWKVPNDFKGTMNNIVNEIKETKGSLEKRNLIYRSEYITIIFTDKYFNWVVQDEFKKHENEKDVCIIVSDWGLIRVRINERSSLTKDQKDELREYFTGTKNIGHENAFTWKIQEQVNFENIMKNVENVTNYINEEIIKSKGN